ncbi:MAG: guanylate kinase [Deltaproteobacteria bacterium]|nr:guanylate kinase [Deltaproteobacteria bacterium]
MARQSFPVVLSAPSGTGKTTLAHLLVDSVANLEISVSHTTRPRRGNERDHVDYHFISDDEFDAMIQRKAFLEWAPVHSHRYGSSAEWTQGKLDEKKDVIFDIDVQGGLQIKKRFPQSVLIFILPPSLEELKNRLLTRGTEQPGKIESRIEAARQEIETGLATYDYVINNEKLDRALFDLASIIRTNRLMGFDREKIRRKLLGE